MNIKRNYFSRFGTFAITIFVAVSLGCSGQQMGSGNGTTSSSGTIKIAGTGSTFVKPIMDKWGSEYGKINPNIQIDYSGTGSGAGIKGIQNRTVDFGGSDAAMTDDEMKQTTGGEIVHLPVVLGAVVLTYNLPDVKEPLKLTPELISDIYLGKIRKWNDPKLKAENANLNLPDTDITPVFRADGSGTSDIITDYLSKTVPEWKEKVGRTKNPQLPQGIGIGAKGNEGVMGQVKNTPNTIGYVELTFAKANNLPAAQIKNKAGNFVTADSSTVSKAAAAFTDKMADDLRFEITNADGPEAYPISGTVFMLVYKDQQDAVKGKALVDFLWWAINDGEKFVVDLHYAPLPDTLVQKVDAKLLSITSGGKPLRQ